MQAGREGGRYMIANLALALTVIRPMPVSVHARW